VRLSVDLRNSLQIFQQLYEEGNIVPIALPTNEFKNQEPGDNYEIIQFCRTRYNISFPVCKKNRFNTQTISKIWTARAGTLTNIYLIKIIILLKNLMLIPNQKNY
jgi:glutathione peroxidase-family protein